MSSLGVSVTSALQVDMAREIMSWVVRYERPAGFHLREEELARQFKVSRSPIRGALALLAQHGIVEQRPNRGFFLSKSGADLDSQEDTLPASANDELYRNIATAWFNGELPDQVSTAELRRRFSLSGTTLARALKRLTEDGIISQSAGNGWRLEPGLATEAAYQDSYSLRMLIEPAAIVAPTFHLNTQLAARCRKRHERILRAERRESIKEMVDADIEFHRLIAESCGNQFLAQTIIRQNTLRRLTEILTVPESTRLYGSCAEHLAILDSIEAGAFKSAAKLMKRHLTVSRAFRPSFRAAPTGG